MYIHTVYLHMHTFNTQTYTNGICDTKRVATMIRVQIICNCSSITQTFIARIPPWLEWKNWHVYSVYFLEEIPDCVYLVPIVFVLYMLFEGIPIRLLQAKFLFTLSLLLFGDVSLFVKRVFHLLFMRSLLHVTFCRAC